jgi:hypothetical protein
MRVTLDSWLILGGVLMTACLAIVGALWMSRRRRDLELRQINTPLLVMPATSASDHSPLSPLLELPLRRPTAMRSMARTDSAGHVDAPEVAGAEHTHSEAPYSGNVAHDPLTATTGKFTSGAVPPEVVHGHSLRFHRPPEGTLEFLPGSLQVIGGPDAGHEVRFVRPEDGSPGVVTFGRKEGPAYTHVQLLEPTVSRSHARLQQEGERWRLINLSRTNPVVLNRRPLDGVEASALLSDEDLIEMGALVFRYHTR